MLLLIKTYQFSIIDVILININYQLIIDLFGTTTLVIANM